MKQNNKNNINKEENQLLEQAFDKYGKELDASFKAVQPEQVPQAVKDKFQQKKKKPIFNFTKLKLGIATSLMAVLIVLVSVISFGNSGIDGDGLVYASVYPDGLTSTEYRKYANDFQDNEDYKTNVNDFAMATASKLLGDNESNEIYSPLSLYFAMTLLTSGADGETLEELLAVMNETTVDELVDNANTMYNVLYTNNDTSKTQIANSLWIADNLNFQKNYLDYAEKLFASIYNVDFSDPKTLELQNQWIEENTNGTLDTTDRRIDANAIISIINTIYYYSEWNEEFVSDDNIDGQFTLDNGEIIDTEFMTRYFKKSATFYENEKFQRSSYGLDLKDGSNVVFVLPKDGYNVYDLLETEDSLNESFFGGTKYKGELTYEIPKFTAKSEFDIIETMKELGVEKAFDADNAEFQNMLAGIETGSVSKISQKASFSIDENGVEASSYTEVALRGTGGPIASIYKCDMILNKPFLYGIEKDGVLMFVGVCNNPNEIN